VKVTAIIPDELVRETQSLSNARNITEAMIIALKNYIALQKVKAMGEAISNSPLKFKHSAKEIRETNRQ
jgi:hypothetical protein